MLLDGLAVRSYCPVPPGRGAPAWMQEAWRRKGRHVRMGLKALLQVPPEVPGVRRRRPPDSAVVCHPEGLDPRPSLPSARGTQPLRRRRSLHRESNLAPREREEIQYPRILGRSPFDGLLGKIPGVHRAPRLPDLCGFGRVSTRTFPLEGPGHRGAVSGVTGVPTVRRSGSEESYPVSESGPHQAGDYHTVSDEEPDCGPRP